MNSGKNLIYQRERKKSGSSPAGPVTLPSVESDTYQPLSTFGNQVIQGFFKAFPFTQGNNTGNRPADHEQLNIIQKKSPAPLQKHVSEYISPRFGTDVKGTVQMHISKDRTVQRRVWDNVPSRYQTVNPEKAQNSEYIVTETGYERYAPINIQRYRQRKNSDRGEARKKLKQGYFLNNNRNFVYIRSKITDKDLNSPRYAALYESPVAKKIDDRHVMFSSRTKPKLQPVITNIEPTNGAHVYDCTVDDSGNVEDGMHVGHPITALNTPLPTLDFPDKKDKAIMEFQKLKDQENI